MGISSYRDLRIWIRSKEYVAAIYKVTAQFPSSERFALANQMQRAAVSIPSNIAEGFQRRSRKDKSNFLRIAYGSGAELETQIEICFMLKYIEQSTYDSLVSELDQIMRMINRNIDILERTVC